MHARTRTRGRSCRYGRGRCGGRAHRLRRSRPHSALATAATAHAVHSSCTASIAAQQFRLAALTDRAQLQRCREGAAGGRDGCAPGRRVRRAAASLQGTPQRCRLGTRSAHGASCLLRVARAHLLAAAAPDPVFASTLFVCLFVCWLVGWFVCLFVCLLVCLFAWLFVCDGPLRNTPLMAQPTPHARRRVVMDLFAACCTGVRCACTGALPPTPPSCCRTSALHQCVCIEVPPKRRVLCYYRVEPAPESPHRQTLLHASTQSHKRKAATQASI